MTVAFVLQGGGSLSAGQVGMLRALTEAGIRPDLIVGSSAGALNAVAFAQDPTAAGLEELRQRWTRVHRHDVFPVQPGRGWQQNRPARHVRQRCALPGIPRCSAAAFP